MDIGAASLLPTLLLTGAALTLPRGHERSVRVVLDRLVLGLLPTAVALIHLLPRGRPERNFVFTYEGPGAAAPTVHLGNPYPFPELTESRTLITALGIGLLVAVVWSWRDARTRPEAALGTALVLLTVATALVLRAAARLESRPHDLRQGRRSLEA